MPNPTKTKSAAVLTTKTQTPVEASKTTEAAAPGRKMTEFQELACDLFSSFLFENAAPELARQMVRTLAAMQRIRLMHKDYPRDRAERVASAESWAETFTEDWYGKLLRGIPETATKEPAAKPANASEKYRGLMRSDARAYFEQFMGSGAPEEIAFLAEVLRTRDGNSSVAMGERVEELSIATAFETTLTNHLGVTYLRVPEEAADAVTRLLNFQKEAA